MPVTNHYEVLGLDVGSNDVEIRRALADERKTWVPRQNAADETRRLEAERRVVQLDEVERILLNPTRRRSYDQSIAIARGQRPRTQRSSKPFATIEDLWHGDDVLLDVLRRNMPVRQGSAVKLSQIVELLRKHPHLAPNFRLGGSADTYQAQLVRVAESLGLRWRRE